MNANTTKKTVKPTGKITDRIKTFEDACKSLKLDPVKSLPYKTPKTKREKAINDLTRLDIIVEALQEGWQPNWNDHNERKWRPWFSHSEGSGFGFSYSAYGAWSTCTYCGSRLCLPTEELADYFGEQFIEIHNRILTNKY